MRKLHYFALASAMIICFGTVSFLAFGNKVDTSDTNNIQANETQELILNTVENFNLVEGESKQLYLSCNKQNAEIQVVQNTPNIVEMNDDYFFSAISVGQTTLEITATWNEYEQTKIVNVLVEERQMSFTVLNGIQIKAGQKVDGSYETYSMKIEANYDLTNSTLSLSDNVFVINDQFLNDDNTSVLIYFYLTNGGEFSFVMDEFSLSDTSTNYISNLNLAFENNVLSEDIVTTYLFEEGTKQAAYLDGFYDYATLISNIEYFEVVVEDENIVSYENGQFKSSSIGSSMITFLATDGSGYEKQIIFNVEELDATDCTTNLQAEYTLLVGDSIEFQITSFLPEYARVKNYSFQTSDNLTLQNGTILAEQEGVGFVSIYINGNLAFTSNITVNLPQQQQTTYEVLFDPTPGVSVDYEMGIITFNQVGVYGLRYYAQDDQNTQYTGVLSANIDAGSNTVYVDGSILTFDISENGQVEIVLNDVNYKVTFDIIVVV